jgi:hypothetical protein
MKNLYKRIYLLITITFLLSVFVSAQSNQYLHFDREDDFAILNEAGQYIQGGDAMSITGWFLCDQLAYGQGYMGFRAGSGDGEFYLIQLNNGVMECRIVTTTGLHQFVAPANTAIPQVWQHISWVFDGSSVKLYVNANLIGSGSASGNFSNASVPFGIGKSLLGGFNFVYGGGIDELSVWDKAISQSEIQDMMDNELSGNEEHLQLYYKFNQGEPGGDNTGITHLVCEVGNGERDAELMNFALMGETSNFIGELEVGYQAISFPEIPTHLTSDAPFQLDATATSGLTVSFTVISGPATVDGNTLTLTGDEGEVIIEATQEGDAQYDPAEPIQNAFQVVNSSTFTPDIDARSPLSGDVYVPNLAPIQLATICTIDYPELFYVQNVRFHINGETIIPTNYYNGHYEGWWTPPAYGNYTLSITANNNFGATGTETVEISIVETTTDMSAVAVEGVWCNPSIPTVTVEAEMPSFLGAFDHITGTLEVECPDGGCGEWDRVASIDAKGHNGQWIEIIRYITPYGVPCTHHIDLTDYTSLLQGKVSFRVNSPTLDNGYVYNLTIDYEQGIPDHLYSTVHEVWKGYYPFGDYAVMQPVDSYSFNFKDNVVAAKLKLVSTGHGWGDLNTSNAAEFYEATHHIWINGEQTFEQHNWQVCNPNPDACQPQNGTWYYNRAGWCPGSIAPWFDYDLTSYISNESIEMDYVFFEDYIDYCHPNHPDCVTGVTCSNCNDGFNPALAVASNIIVFSNQPIITGVEDRTLNTKPMIHISPNPTKDYINISVITRKEDVNGMIQILSMDGKMLDQYELTTLLSTFNISDYPAGTYIVKIDANGFSETQKIVKQ